METFVETKSKYLAFSFTIIIHFVVLLLFLLMGFVKPAENKIVLETSCGEQSLQGFEVADLNNLVVSSKTPSSEKLVSDPNEKIVKLEQGNAQVKANTIATAENIEYNAVLKKWKELKNRKTQKGNLIDADFKNGNNSNAVNSTIENNETFVLTNRLLVVKPETILNNAEEGKVVVEIIVNEKGEVISAVPGQRGSTTTSSVLYKKAVKSAYTAQFNHANDGAGEQRGTYTFVFTLE